MGNMMISDLCCEAQLQQTHTHPPIHVKHTHSCSHVSSAFRFCSAPRVERGISHGKVEGSNPTGPLSSATVHWSAVMAMATHTKTDMAQLHTAAPVLCFPLYSEQRFLWVYMTGGRRVAQQGRLAGFSIFI